MGSNFLSRTKERVNDIAECVCRPWSQGRPSHATERVQDNTTPRVRPVKTLRHRPYRHEVHHGGPHEEPVDQPDHAVQVQVGDAAVRVAGAQAALLSSLSRRCLNDTRRGPRATRQVPRVGATLMDQNLRGRSGDGAERTAQPFAHRSRGPIRFLSLAWLITVRTVINQQSSINGQSTFRCSLRTGANNQHN